MSVSEICLIGKPAILVPSPNVAEDHQTKNAQALVKNAAAVLIKDSEAKDELVPSALSLLQSDSKRQSLGENALKMSFQNAADHIADEVLNLLVEA